MVLSTSGVLGEWGPVCHPSMTVVHPQAGGGKVWLSVHVGIVQAVLALDKTFVAFGVAMRPGVCGCFVCRQITGGGSYSIHAVACALDINWDQNPYSTTHLTMAFPPALVHAVCAIHTRGGQQVWVSGADFDNNGVLGDHGPFDAMHFQIACTRAQLAGGIDWATVHTTDVPTPPSTPQETFMANATTGELRALVLAAANEIVDGWYATYAYMAPWGGKVTGGDRGYWRDRVLDASGDSTTTRLNALEGTFAGAIASALGVQPPTAPK